VVQVQVVVAVYARISFDWEGLGLGVERQIKDCMELAERLGWLLGELYVDNNISAYSGKHRPAYTRMLADLEAGKCNALICYDLDRLSRNPIEIEHIIDLAEKDMVRLATVTGAYDLATPTGRLHARIKASVARHESEQTASRIRRKVQERAEAGKPHGQKAYGWERVDGRDILEPTEAAVVREIADRLLGGESVSTITKSLNARGILSPYGKEWTRTTVRHMVLRERNAGFRRHQDKIIGKGDWQPIFDEDTYHRLHALLSDPGRKVTTGSAFRHLLTGIAKCGKCGKPVRLLIAHEGRSKSYSCGNCMSIRRRQEDVDRIITKLVVGRLAKPDAKAIFMPLPDPSLAEEAAGIRAKLDLAADQYAVDEIDGEQLKRISARLRPRLAELEVLLRPAVLDLADLATPDIAERWDDVPLERQRAAIDFLLDITLLPRGKRGNAFDPESIKVEWKRG
jgi:site-specific DNA recombinase